MAQTHYDATDAEAKILLEEELYREAEIEGFFSKFTSKNGSNIVHEKSDFEKEKGGKLTFTLIRKLKADGITGSSGLTLEDNAEKIVTTTQSIYLEEYAHATEDDGPLTRQHVFFSIDAEARNQLKVWMRERREKLTFTALYSSPTKIFYGTPSAGLAALASLTSTMKLTPEMISWVKTWALTGGNETQEPISGVMIDGKPHLVLLVHSDALFDLKRNSEFQQAMREAAVRGAENPIFKGSTAVWDGVVIHEHMWVPIGTDAGVGGDVPYCKCALLGKQAILRAVGKRPEIRAEEWDFGRKHGFGISMMESITKAKFDVKGSGSAKDLGMIGLYVARTQISDAT